MTSIDDEWMKFIVNQDAAEKNIRSGGCNKMRTIDLLDEDEFLDVNDFIDAQDGDNEDLDRSIPPPPCGELKISTKTKVVFLNKTQVDIDHVFWNIPVIEYWNPVEGVVKKQMKIVCKSPEEFQEYQAKLTDIPYYTENIIKEINNPDARRIKFKFERKITIGVSRKDIMNCRGKPKNAFYNCFAMILRFKYEGLFREIHVKVFNTGKMEIPGILSIDLLESVKKMVIRILKPLILNPDDPTDDVYFVENHSTSDIAPKCDENVLINSNFNCGFFINRSKLNNILNGKYSIETSYDPSSYPGVKCKFYFNNEKGFSREEQTGCISKDDHHMKMSELIETKKYTEVSFMIFRTGSCLIVGNCSEKILVYIYEYIRDILTAEYYTIFQISRDAPVKSKKPKLRKKIIQRTLASVA